ncbi:hypothetical protein SFUMM280S_06197 [Streptomyces fumanus]
MYCARSFVPSDRNSTSRRIDRARSAADGISTMAPYFAGGQGLPAGVRERPGVRPVRHHRRHDLQVHRKPLGRLASAVS